MALRTYGETGDTYGGTGDVYGDTTTPSTPSNRMGGTGAIRKPPRRTAAGR